MLAFVCLFAGIRPWEALPTPTSCRKVQLELAPASRDFFKHGKCPGFFLLFFLLFVGWGGKKINLLSAILVVFKLMPVLNVHISYGPDDEFLGGTGKSGLPSDAVGSMALSSLRIQAVLSAACHSELQTSSTPHTRAWKQTRSCKECPEMGFYELPGQTQQAAGSTKRHSPRCSLADTSFGFSQRSFWDSEVKHFNFYDVCLFLVWVLSWHNQAGAVGLSVWYII